MSLSRVSDRVWSYRDTCNVYAVTCGDRAILIDFGSGAILDHLGDMGVAEVDWVLHTHHHRDQCQGDARLAGTETRIAVPSAEVAHFGGSAAFWQTVPLSDIYDCSSLYNTLAASVPVDRPLADYDVFEWCDIKVLALPTPGHTRGSLTYVVDVDSRRYAFTGDLMSSGGRAHTLHDMDWKYGMSEGFKLAAQSAATLRTQRPKYLGPSHGEAITEPDVALARFEDTLLAYLRHSDLGYQTSLEPQQVTPSSAIEQLGDHLFAVTSTCAHFYVLRSDTGATLFFDYGFATEVNMAAHYRFTEHTLADLQERFGLQPPEVVVPTHYHDDHVCGIPYLQRRYGTEVWAFEVFAPILERPSSYRIPCLWREPITVSRVLEQGEFRWHEFQFDIHHNPGHTWYAASIFADIDGRRVGITGDELQISPSGSLWGGAPVYRNRVGGTDFSSSIATILKFEPELVLTGHKGPLEVTRADLEGFRSWALGIEQCWRELAANPDAMDVSLDPDWVSVMPYALELGASDSGAIEVEVRNHHPGDLDVELRIDLPDVGWTVEPQLRRLSIAPGSAGRAGFTITTAEDAAPGVRHVVTVDVTADARRLGQVTEALVIINAPETSATH